MMTKWQSVLQVGRLLLMKNSRSLSITRLTITLTATLLWACSGGGGEGTTSEDVSAPTPDTGNTGTADAGPDGQGTADIDPPQGDVITHGKDDVDEVPDADEGDGATDPGDGGTTDPGDGTTDPGDGTTDPGDGTTDPGDGGTTDPGDGETTDPGDGGTTDPGDGGTTDPGDGGTTDPGDGGATEDDAVTEPDVVEGPSPCDGADQDSCDDQGATRCSADGAALIQACKLSGGCLQWLDSEFCQYDDVFPNACTGKADICVDGHCVPDGDDIAGCPGTDNPCEMPTCDGATGDCTITMVEPGTPCDDADVCTKDDICFGSECIGAGANALGQPICPQYCLDGSASLGCSEYASFELNGDIGTSLMDEYSCDDAVGYTGYETAFLIEAPNLAYEMPLTLAVELADPALKGVEYADIVVLETSPGYACWANTCVAVGYMDETGVATVEVAAFVDEDDDPSNDPSYIVLVDGRDGFSGAVRLANWCMPGYTDIELYCTDGIDDDTDGMIDCEDPSCWDSLTCLFEHDCANGLDDDEDGAQDCADDDCAEHPDCYVETDCEDGIDDEGDGFTDCEDSDCEFTPSCGNVCEDAIPVGCGDVLLGQDPSTGSNTFTSFPCSPTGLGIESAEYESPHHVYHVQADEDCAARVRVSPESEDFVVLDIYAMGPGCSTDHCIEVEGGFDCQDPQTPASAFGGDACVQIPLSFSGSSWVTVIPDNMMLSTESDLSYGLEVICDCE
jgi:hypothetical protein